MLHQPSLFPLPPAQLDPETAEDVRRLLERCPDVTATLTISGVSTNARTGRKTTRSVKTEVDGDTLLALITPRLPPRRADSSASATLSTVVEGERLEADMDDPDASHALISRVITGIGHG